MAHSPEASTERILREVISAIKPSPKDERETRAVAEEVMRRLRSALPNEIGIELVGSVAKGTALAGSGDIDVFITFPRGKYAREDLEHKGLAFAKKALKPGEKWEIGFAEHPYLKAVIHGKDVEIVPAFKISSASEKASAADRSPLHTEYVLKRITEKQKDDVRLLKKFLKRLAVYGAEVKVEGFSGYLCELLVLRHGSFLKLLAEARHWHEEVVDLEGAYASASVAREHFAFPPLVVVDPVDAGRNVAAAVSETSLSKFVLAARAFHASPSTEFFFGTPLKLTQEKMQALKTALLGKDSPRVLAVRFPVPRLMVPDTLWPQLRRTARIMFDRLNAAGFEVFDYNYWTDEDKECVVIFQFTVCELPNLEKVTGPEIQFEEGAADFISAHRNAIAGPWVGGNRVYSARKRRFTHARDIVAHISEHPKEFGIPSKIGERLAGAKTVGAAQLLSKKYASFAYDFIHKKHYYLG